MANNLPKHIDKITDPKRKAVAPYNFVELPDKVVEAQALPDGDRYWQESEHQGNDQIIKISRHTGKIECTLTTSSPLYIRCGLDPLNYEKYGDKYPEEPKSMTEAEKRKWETDKKQWEEEKRNGRQLKSNGKKKREIYLHLSLIIHPVIIQAFLQAACAVCCVHWSK